MSKYNPDKHHRKSIRLKGYDYGRQGLYFITLCCQDRAHLLGKVDQKQMNCNRFGEIVAQEWLNTATVRKNVRLHEFIIMPNHIHGIIEIVSSIAPKGEEQTGKFVSPSHTIGAIIRGFKVASIKKIKTEIQKIITENSTSYITEQEQEHCFPFDAQPSYPLPDALPHLDLTPQDRRIIGRIISLDYKIWQRNYYEHIIKTERAYLNISNYIINNPQKWEEDKLNRIESDPKNISIKIGDISKSRTGE